MFHSEQEICAEIRKLEDIRDHAVTPYSDSYSDVLWKLAELRCKLYWEIEERRNWE